MLELPDLYPLHVPAPGDAAKNYTQLDSELVAWHARMNAVNDRIAQMAVVGKMEGAGVVTGV